MREALKEGKTLREMVVGGGLLSTADFERIISKALGPSEVDKAILGRAKREKQG
ncbi:MAG: hypothetical protein V1827_04990 [Candidatus Micrarchaeota archaeon]